MPAGINIPQIISRIIKFLIKTIGLHDTGILRHGLAGMLMIYRILFADGQLIVQSEDILGVIRLGILDGMDLQLDEVVLAVLHVKTITLAFIALFRQIHDHFVIIVDISLVIVFLTHACPPSSQIRYSYYNKKRPLQHRNFHLVQNLAKSADQTKKNCEEHSLPAVS